MPEKQPIRGRLAPSPTGALHLGNARSFLLAWLSIRSRGETLVLRIEDLDHPKIKRGSLASIYTDLKWLGLTWDEGPKMSGPHAPYIQSQRIASYRTALNLLIQKDLVYPCVCSRKDIEEAQSAPHQTADGLFYPGTCRGRFDSYAQAKATLPDGRLPGWRFKTPDTTSSFTDHFCGAQQQNVAEAVGDFCFARHPDGAGYLLAVVVDDAAMGITEVLRGDDLLLTTHRQLLLYDALDLPQPAFLHVPLILGENGKRLAKRHGDTQIAALRERGVRPEKVIGLLAWWSGLGRWGEELCADDLLVRYDIKQLNTKPSVLTHDVKKLLGIQE